MPSYEEAVEFLETHPDRIRRGVDKWGKPCWQWSGDGKWWVDGYSFLSAVAAARPYVAVEEWEASHA